MNFASKGKIICKQVLNYLMICMLECLERYLQLTLRHIIKGWINRQMDQYTIKQVQ